MAKTKTTASKAKKKPKQRKTKAKKAKVGKAQSSFDAVAKLAEHPIVADLIAIGATAAVTAIAGRHVVEVGQDVGQGGQGRRQGRGGGDRRAPDDRIPGGQGQRRRRPTSKGAKAAPKKA